MDSDTHQYVAFDLGASSGRAVLGTLDGDVMTMEEVHRFDTPIAEENGHIRWKIDVIWDELRTGLRLALQDADQLRSVSVDSWGVDYVSMDANGRPTHAPYCYRDDRLDGRMEKALEVLPPEDIYAITGIQFMQINTLYQLLADLAEDAEALAAVDCHLTMADYFNYRFSGKKLVEVSLASTTQMMDARTRQWSPELLSPFDLDAYQWPDIVPSGTILGPMRDRPDIHVVATCSHDTGAAVAAVPAVNPHGSWAYISCGTWSLLGVERREPLLTEAARKAGFTNEAGIDGSIRLLKNLTGLWALQECAREWGEVDWSELEAEARAASETSARIDLEDPRFLKRGGMEERLRAYGREHGVEAPKTRGGLARVILVSIAESYRRTIGELEALIGETIDRIHLVGGGSQNRLLCELTAEVCEKEVVAGPAEATALGNLLIQARAMGHLPPDTSIRDVAAKSSDLEINQPTLRSN